MKCQIGFIASGLFSSLFFFVPLLLMLTLYSFFRYAFSFIEHFAFSALLRHSTFNRLLPKMRALLKKAEDEQNDREKSTRQTTSTPI